MVKEKRKYIEWKILSSLHSYNRISAAGFSRIMISDIVFPWVLTFMMEYNCCHPRWSCFRVEKRHEIPWNVLRMVSLRLLLFFLQLTHITHPQFAPNIEGETNSLPTSKAIELHLVHLEFLIYFMTKHSVLSAHSGPAEQELWSNSSPSSTSHIFMCKHRAVKFTMSNLKADG